MHKNSPQELPDSARQFLWTYFYRYPDLCDKLLRISCQTIVDQSDLLGGTVNRETIPGDMIRQLPVVFRRFRMTSAKTDHGTGACRDLFRLAPVVILIIQNQEYLVVAGKFAMFQFFL